MNKPVISTRGTNNFAKLAALIGFIFFALIFAIIFVIIIKRVDSYPSIFRDQILKRAAVPTIAWVVISMLVLLFYALMYASCRAYVDVFEDRMEGKGIQNLYTVVDFKLDRTQIINVTYVRNQLYINAVAGKYKIITNSETAKRVFDYCNMGWTQ